MNEMNLTTLNELFYEENLMLNGNFLTGTLPAELTRATNLSESFLCGLCLKKVKDAIY